jgi:peptidyl-prolyl cis-trans isomerase C
LKTFYDYMILILFLQGLFLIGCQNTQPDPIEIVARVGNDYLTRETVNSLIPENLSEDDRNSLIKNLVDKWIEREVLAQTAINEGIKLTPNDTWQVESVKSEMYASKLLSEQIPKDFTITDKEIEDYYSSNPNQFQRKNDEVHIVHLFLENRDKVIVSEIKQSSALIEVIQKNFLDRQATRVIEPNDDLGYVEVDKLRPELQRAIRGTKTGNIYGPIRTKEGYHFLQVLDRKPAKTIRNLDLVRDEIIDLLKIEKRKQKIKSYKENIRKNFQIETFYSNIE